MEITKNKISVALKKSLDELLDNRTGGQKPSILVCSSCRNKIPGWFRQQKFIYHSLEAGSLRSGCHGLVSPWLPHSRLLPASSVYPLCARLYRISSIRTPSRCVGLGATP